MGSAQEKLREAQRKVLPAFSGEIDSQVEAVQYKTETGEGWSVVDGEIYPDGPEGWRQAAYMILSLQWRIDVTSKRKWVYWRPNRRIKKIQKIGK